MPCVRSLTVAIRPGTPQTVVINRGLRPGTPQTVVINRGLRGEPGANGDIVSFETVSKNLSAAGAVLAYTDGQLTSITYANGIIKTLAYTAGKLTTITLSGNTPNGISLVKPLTYTGDNLTGITYS